MKTLKTIGRIISINCNAELDNGEILSLNLSNKDLISCPGVDSIHTVSSLIGHLIGTPIEQFVIKNPIESQLIKDVKNKLVEVHSRTSIIHLTKGVKVDLYTIKGFKQHTYKYDSYQDAYDDLEYCRKYLNN